MYLVSIGGSVHSRRALEHFTGAGGAGGRSGLGSWVGLEGQGLEELVGGLDLGLGGYAQGYPGAGENDSMANLSPCLTDILVFLTALPLIPLTTTIDKLSPYRFSYLLIT